MLWVRAMRASWCGSWLGRNEHQDGCCMPMAFLKNPILVFSTDTSCLRHCSIYKILAEKSRSDVISVAMRMMRSINSVGMKHAAKQKRSG